MPKNTIPNEPETKEPDKASGKSGHSVGHDARIIYIWVLPLQDSAICGNGNHLPGNEFSAVFQRRHRCMLDSAAAGNLHAHPGQRPDFIFPDDLLQFLGIVHHIQLGAADERHTSADEVLMKAAVGIGGAVGRDQQIGSVEIRSKASPENCAARLTAA